LNRDRPFQAAIFDMDGVLTHTARLHEGAWKQMFDDFLAQHDGQEPFSSADYRAHVDGKPRYQGVADFLASRRVELPRGDPGDDPAQETICGLGNRKNELFLELLDHDGVEVFPDAVVALARWRRGGLKLAAVSASRNCRRVLKAVDLVRRFDAIVDGQVAAKENLGGKPEIMAEAARRLGIEPGDGVILEDATAGVRAGRQDGFGLVVGVARDGSGEDLTEAGAHMVVSDISRLRFPRKLPPALARLEELAAWRQDRPLAVFLDFDGTLSPIVKDPAEASISEEMRSVVRSLRCPVAIISGRDRRDVEYRAGLEGIIYAGNHGLDIAGKGRRRTLPEAEEALDDVDQAEEELKQSVGDLDGVVLERKRYSIAVHYRQVQSQSTVERVRQAVADLQEKTGLRQRGGKKVLELEPDIDWDKGRALTWLTDVLPDSPRPWFVMYIGDDETDEDAFAALGDDGPGVRVGSETAASLADYHLRDPDEVLAYLGRLAEMCDEQGGD
jgi:trehalose-phosphatase